eukprot:3649270-Pyramimonas_sp.AAC.1
MSAPLSHVTIDRQFDSLMACFLMFPFCSAAAVQTRKRAKLPACLFNAQGKQPTPHEPSFL